MNITSSALLVSTSPRQMVDLNKVSDYISEVTPEETLEFLGFSLNDVPAPAANYQGVVVNGGTAYVSGCLPIASGGKLNSKGKLGREVSLEEGQKAAALCAANILRLMKRQLGELSKIKRLVRLGGFVHCTEEFTEAHLVINGASNLMIEVLGDKGRHARAAIGVVQLPLGASVEVDAIFELEPS